MPPPRLWDETPPPSWSQLRRRLFCALLAATARFQVFAAGVDKPLVYQEGAGTDPALGGRRAGGVRGRRRPAAAPRGGLGVGDRVAPPEVMFGDLHFGNAVFRQPPHRLAALLFDPIPRRQPWPFEPACFESAYFEVVCGGSGLVAEMAAIRGSQGRPTGGPDR